MDKTKITQALGWIILILAVVLSLANCGILNTEEETGNKFVAKFSDPHFPAEYIFNIAEGGIKARVNRFESPSANPNSGLPKRSGESEGSSYSSQGQI